MKVFDLLKKLMYMPEIMDLEVFIGNGHSTAKDVDIKDVRREGDEVVILTSNIPLQEKKLMLFVNDWKVTEIYHTDAAFLSSYRAAFCHGAYHCGARKAIGYILPDEKEQLEKDMGASTKSKPSGHLSEWFPCDNEEALQLFNKHHDLHLAIEDGWVTVPNNFVEDFCIHMGIN